jgi:trans-aconitate methyltransferase
MPYRLHPIGTRKQLRETFDRVAEVFDAMRPSYPATVFDDVVQISGAGTDSNILEIGCGTGHATQIFAMRGARIHALELGENLAALARERLAEFPNVTVEVGDFDTWSTTQRFDLVFAATAYHWLNPATREERIASMLQPSGWLAIWRNRHIRNGSCDDFLDELQVIYQEEAPQLTHRRALLPKADEVLDAERDELTTGHFGEQVFRSYLWSMPYNAGDYVKMLSTHSDHQLLSPERRARLFDRIVSVIETHYGGSVIKDYATILQMTCKQS